VADFLGQSFNALVEFGFRDDGLHANAPEESGC